MEASYDVRSMCATSTKIFVLEVMGRHAGWIAAAGALIEDYGIACVTLFPEVPFDQTKFLALVKSKVEATDYGRPMKLFFIKSQTFELGQTIWAKHFGGI